MKTSNFLVLGFSFFSFGCGQSTNNFDANKQNSEKVTLEAKFKQLDTSNQYIYDFMKIVIYDQRLDMSFGLNVEPEKGCNLFQEDQVFLKKLLVGKIKPESKSDNLNIVVLNTLPDLLTKTDIEEMLKQKMQLANFNWDISRLGFNAINRKNWYCFSKPLFSKDRQKVVMLIRSLCDGLCGGGWTVVFIKENNKWTSQTVDQWMH
jgi:hypothetical protein